MKFFNNLKINIKLTIGFFVIIVLMFIIGIVSITSLNDVFTKKIPAIDYLIETDRDLQQLLVSERSMIFSDSKSEVFTSLKADYNENLQQSQERWEKYKALASSKEEKALFSDYEAARKEWEVLTSQIVNGRVEDTREGRSLAIDLTLGMAKEKFEVMRNVLDELTIINLALVEKTKKILLLTLLSILLISVSAGILLALTISRSITKPLSKVVKAGKKIALGQFPDEEINVDSKDEIGILANVFDKIVTNFRNKGDELTKIADGDLTVQVKYESGKDQFAQTFDKMLNSLNSSLSTVNSTIEQVAAGSNQVAQASQFLSQGASEQASSLEEVTSSIVEISNQARQNAENAENGNVQMKELVIAMDSINKSADEIKRIVKVIDDIAFQTNLLALNANVEAARAGKYGKGFAVVAEEVRNLASRSAASVQETTTMVEETIKNINSGNSLVEVTAKQLEEIVVASKEQTEGLNQINTGLSQIDQVTQANTANAEESASAAEELASQSQQLKTIIARFKFSDSFLDDIQNNDNISDDLIKRIKEEILKAQSKKANKKNSLDELDEYKKTGKNKKNQKKISHSSQAEVNEVDMKENITVNPKKVINLDDEDFENF